MFYTQVTIQCYPKKTALCGMLKGSATADHQFAYITSHHSRDVYQYKWTTEEWTKLPYRDSALVIINGELTAIGGYNLRDTNKLFTLQQGQWVREYPPMYNERSRATAVSTSDGEFIVVIGGSTKKWITSVELFRVSSRRWYRLTDLPKPIAEPSAAICGNQLHVMGEGDEDGFSCSLQALLSSDRPTIQYSMHVSWKSLPSLPVKYSTAATVCGQLVIIGGWSAGAGSVNSIHQCRDGQWVRIGSMTHSRWQCLAVSPSPEKLIVFGGGGRVFNDNSVEEGDGCRYRLCTQ